MAALRPAWVRRLCRLAGLRPGEGELERLGDDLDRILSHLETLGAAEDAPGGPGSEVSPLPLSPRSPLGNDAPRPGCRHPSPSAAAPAWRDGFYLVPRLPGLGPEDGVEPGGGAEGGPEPDDRAEPDG